MRALARAVRAESEQLPAARSDGDGVRRPRRRPRRHPRAGLRIGRSPAAGVDGTRAGTRRGSWRALRRRGRRAIDVRRRLGRAPQRRGRSLARGVPAHALLARPGGGARRDHGHVRDAITWDRFEPSTRREGRRDRAVAAWPPPVGGAVVPLHPPDPRRPGPYFTLATRAADGCRERLAAWREIKLAATTRWWLTADDTHPTRSPRPPQWLRAGSRPLFRGMLAAAKHAVDPQGILNPGVLFDP